MHAKRCLIKGLYDVGLPVDNLNSHWSFLLQLLITFKRPPDICQTSKSSCVFSIDLHQDLSDGDTKAYKIA